MLVVDSNSTDATIAIAKAAGATVIERDWRGFIDARVFALAAVQTAWTLMIDADEELDSVLRGAIESVPDDDASAFTISRTTYFGGKPMRIWRDEKIVRLFKTHAATLRSKAMADGAQVHEVWSVAGTARELPGELRHFSYEDMASYRQKFERYTELESIPIRATKFQSGVAGAEAVVRFLYLLIVRGALLDGRIGVLVAWFSARYRAVVLKKAAERS